MAQSREEKVDEFLRGLPRSITFSRQSGDGTFELRSDGCIIRFSFDRYDASSCIIEIVNPKRPSRGMHLFLLQYLRGIVPPTDGDFTELARRFASGFPDLLSGNFEIQSQYDSLETPFFNYLDFVERLPQQHPARILYENHDLNWIKVIQQGLNRS